MKEIILAHGQIAIVDDEDYETIARHKWFAKKHYSDSRHEIWVAIRREINRTVYMHREILGLKGNDGTQVMHINGNRLDNRKANLVVPGHSIVSRGRKFGKGRSQYKGVRWSKRDSGWTATILVSGKHRWLGRFSSETDAALAYDVVARKTYGELTALNFPDVDTRVLPATIPRALKTGRASRYRGVFWSKVTKKWMVMIKIGERMSYLGLYVCEEDAAKAYDAAVIRLGRNRALLNFPESSPEGNPALVGMVIIHQVSSPNEAVHSDQQPKFNGRSGGFFGTVRAFFAGFRRYRNESPFKTAPLWGWQAEQADNTNRATG